MCLATSLAPTHVPTLCTWTLRAGPRRSTRHITRARTTSVQRRMLGIPRRPREREEVGIWEGVGEVAHEPVPGRPSLIIPHLGRLRRAFSWLSAGGQAGPVLLRSRTCAYDARFPPLPTQAPPASRARHLPTTRLCTLLLGPLTAVSVSPTTQAGKGHTMGDMANTRPASKEPRGSSVTSMGEAGHSGPTGLHRGPGVMVLEHLFHFRVDGDPSVP